MNKVSMGVLAALCLGAGAGGAYFATRGDAVAPAPEVGVSSELSPVDTAVEQTEAVVADEQTAPPVAPEVPAPGRVAPPRRPPVTASRPVSAAPPPPVQRPSVPAPAPDPLLPTPGRVEPEAAAVVPEPAAPQFEDLVIAADSVLGLQLETSVTSEQARVEDAVAARVTRDVRVGDRVAIPAGSRAEGEVTTVERGGKLRERARLGVRFTSVVLADGTRVPISTETIYREGDSPATESTAKIGAGAIGGAILGGILGGAKGAIIGGSAGAGAGTAAVVAGGRNPATLQTGTPVTVRITAPATVTVEK